MPLRVTANKTFAIPLAGGDADLDSRVHPPRLTSILDEQQRSSFAKARTAPVAWPPSSGGVQAATIREYMATSMRAAWTSTSTPAR